VEQALLLSEKTFTELKTEQELPFESWETLRVQGKMSFVF
jgi:hypothetical protein